MKGPHPDTDKSRSSKSGMDEELDELIEDDTPLRQNL